MISRPNKTFICSVVFLDIVEYSMKSVEDQIKYKEHLNQHMTEAIKDVAVNDRIILDTGDGAAISFLGDPEDALFVAMSLRDAILNDQHVSGEPLTVRIGINLGPVKLVKDINKRQNLIGDGINVAQRVMSFSKPGEILVSRSYYEVVSCLSKEYSQLFHYQGMRADKHIREHEIYSVEEAAKEPVVSSAGQEQPSEVLAPGGDEGLGPSPADPASASAATASAATATGKKPTSRKVPSPGLPWWRTKKIIYGAVPLAVGLVIVLAFVLRSPKNVAVEGAAAENPDSVQALQAGQAKGQAKAESKDANSLATSPSNETASASMGILQFSIIPWGDVYLDGKRQGASPPLTSLPVATGKHKIDIKNTSFPSYSQTVNIKPNEKVKITHKFR